MPNQPTLHDKRHRGWFWIENNVFDLHGPTLGATGIAIYALLARHVGSDGKAFPTLHRFQTLLGLSRNTVKKYLKLLASPEVGLIRIVERTTLNGDPDSHIYELLTVYGRSTIDLPGSTIDLPGSTIDLGVGQPLTGGRSTIDTGLNIDARVGEGNPLKETQLKEEKKENPPTPFQGNTSLSENGQVPAKAKRHRKFSPPSPEAFVVLTHLNTVNARRYQIPDQIQTLLNTGVSVADCLLVVDFGYAVLRQERAQWYAQYFDNVTPFRPANFDKYHARAQQWQQDGRQQTTTTERYV